MGNNKKCSLNDNRAFNMLFTILAQYVLHHIISSKDRFLKRISTDPFETTKLAIAFELILAINTV
jgi:hypothetical protein